MTPAEIMNMPSAQPSIRYSGQCARSMSSAAPRGVSCCAVTLAGALGILKLCVVTSCCLAGRSQCSTAGFEAGIKRHTAVDEETDTVHVVRIVRCQPDRGTADLVSLTDALVWN